MYTNPDDEHRFRTNAERNARAQRAGSSVGIVLAVIAIVGGLAMVGCIVLAISALSNVKFMGNK